MDVEMERDEKEILEEKVRQLLVFRNIDTSGVNTDCRAGAACC